MDDWGWAGWVMMTAAMVAFWALVAVAVAVATSDRRPPTQHTPAPERTLAQRFGGLSEATDGERRR
jgi:putative membrane protein